MVRKILSCRRSFLSEALEQRQLMAIDVLDSDLAQGGAPACVAAIAAPDAIIEHAPLAAMSGTAQTDGLIAPPPVAQDFETFANDDELKEFLINRAVKQYADVLGKTLDYPPGGGWWWRYGPAEVDVAVPGTNGHSDTNVQVAGVDEADLVETDGNYLYVLRDNELLIFDTRVADQTKLISRTALDNYPTGMFLRGDRLTLIGGNNLYYPAVTGVGIAADVAIWPGNFVNRTNVTILDVSNREAPATLRKFDLDGNYAASRSIDGKIVLIQQQYLNLPVPKYEVIDANGEVVKDPTKPTIQTDARPSIPVWWQSGYKYRVESEASYRAHLQDKILNILPQYIDTPPYPTFAPPSPQRMLQANDVYKPLNDDQWGLTTIAVIDSTLEEPALVGATATFNSYTSTVYVGEKSMYLLENASALNAATQEWDAITNIRKYELTADGAVLAAEGTVRGYVLNQFSVDEHEGNLRIATTQNWGRNAANNVYVLAENGKSLDVVGKIEDLAHGERIFSARFMGDRAYIVTFRQIDPLFTLDMSDPTNPVVRGELKLPGFSTYMQSLNDQYLLGIGRDADPVTGRREEMQVTLFDVNDLANPRVQSQVTIPHTDWTWNDVETNHLAVGWYPEANVLALPVVQSRQGSPVDWNNDGTVDYFAPSWENSLQVFHVSFESAAPNSPQLIPLGQVNHDTQVLRSVRIGEELYSISRDSLKVVPLRDPSNTIKEVFYGREFVGVQTDPDTPGTGQLMVMGSYRDDKIVIQTRADGMIDVSVNGQPRGSFDGSRVTSIAVDGNLGPDSVTLLGGDGLRNVSGANVESIVRRDRGDFNQDGNVDIRDFAMLRTQFGRTGAESADADGDGVVGLKDFRALRAHFNR